MSSPKTIFSPTVIRRAARRVVCPSKIGRKPPFAPEPGKSDRDVGWDFDDHHVVALGDDLAVAQFGHLADAIGAGVEIGEGIGYFAINPHVRRCFRDGSRRHCNMSGTGQNAPSRNLPNETRLT